MQSMPYCLDDISDYVPLSVVQLPLVTEALGGQWLVMEGVGWSLPHSRSPYDQKHVCSTYYD